MYITAQEAAELMPHIQAVVPNLPPNEHAFILDVAILRLEANGAGNAADACATLKYELLDEDEAEEYLESLT